MRLYPAVKAFVLCFMLGVYALFTITLAAAWYAGGWVVVVVDRYREGLPELVMLAALFPLAAYVTTREVAGAVRQLRSPGGS